MEEFSLVRMIALDLDGTLLEPSGKICTQTLQTLGIIHRKGIVIAIATGRPFARTLTPLEENALYPHNPYPDILICEERDVYELHNGRYRAWEENEKALSEEVQWLSFGHQVLIKLEEIAPDLEFALNNSFSQRTRGFVELYFVSQSEAERAFTVLTDLTRQSPLKVIRNRRNICLRARSAGKGESLKKVAASFSFSLDDV